MKKIILLIASYIFAANIIAQNYEMKEQNQKTNMEKYCAMLKGENIVVMSGEKEITSTITLANGTQIKTNGTVVKNDGTKMVLKNGECIDKEGNIVKSMRKDKMKKEESKMPDKK